MNAAALAESEAELARLPSRIDSAVATLARLDEELERIEASTAMGATNEFEVIVARQRAAAQRADVAALRAQDRVLSARVERLRAELRAAERDLDLRIEDQRRLNAATAALRRADAEAARARVDRDEAALELERMVIRAPSAGAVQRRMKVPGDKVVRMMDDPHSAHLVHLYDPSRLQVRVDVPLADAARVSVGQICDIVVEVLPDRTFRGEVLRITREADLQKNTLQVKVGVLDPDPILRPEMLTRVRFLSEASRPGPEAGGVPGSAEALVRIPAAALDERGATPRVWMVTARERSRGVLASRQVRVVTRSDAWITVAGDVAPGALLALDMAAPRDGEHVVIRSLEQAGDAS